MRNCGTVFSRRSFLSSLAVLGIGSAAVASLNVNAGNAIPVTDETIANDPKDFTNTETLSNGKKTEIAQQVDPDDPLQHFAQPYYRHRRRVARRVYRRSWRVSRRYYRRGRRYVRRTYRRVRRRAYWY